MKMLCSVQLSKHRYKTPEGYLVCKDCIIARTGKQTYLKSELYGLTEGEDEYIEVDRKANQVFDDKTMASFEGKPLTIEHPDVSVSPENYKDLSVGNVHNVRRGKFDGQDVMLADINVYDAEAINLIESGEMEELSCGYDCDITDGPNPEQINIRGNHVALCEQGRAGIARIQDSWGAKPIIKDSVQKGTLIQEFGRYGEQYKVIKIEGNVLYCEELTTHKNTLFKKDKENIDWAIINKSQVNDSVSLKDENKPEVDDPSVGLYVNGEYIEDRSKAWELAKSLFERNELKTFSEYWIDEFGYPHDTDLRNTLKIGMKDSVSTNRKLLYSEEPHYTIELEESTLYHSIDGTGRFSGYRETEYDDKIYDNFEEAKKAATELFNKYKDKTEIKESSYSYYSVKIVRWEEGGGYYVDLNEKDNGPFPALTAFNEKELPEQLKKDLHIKDAKEEKYSPNRYSDEFTKKELDEFIKNLYDNDKTTDLFGFGKQTRERKKKIFVDKEEKEKFYKELEQNEKAEVRADEFDHVFDDERYLVYWEVYYWDDAIKDSFVPLYIISLSEDSWLDENDRPTNDKSKARKFQTEKDADDYRKIYCKGVVQELKDSKPIDEKSLNRIKSLMKYQLEVDYNNEDLPDTPEQWANRMITHYLVNELSRQLTDEEKQFVKEFAKNLYENYLIDYINAIFENQDVWFGCNLRKGKPAEDFKQYLRDRGLYFEPSENGNFIHFEVKNADKDVEDEIRAINNHYEKVGFVDSYSKKFYLKAIKLLEDKLKKLEKNELLDTNQEDYEIQRNKMMDLIKKQIEEYKEKLNDFE